MSNNKWNYRNKINIKIFFYKINAEKLDYKYKSTIYGSNIIIKKIALKLTL